MTVSRLWRTRSFISTCRVHPCARAVSKIPSVCTNCSLSAARYLLLVPKCTHVKQAFACGHSPSWMGSRHTPFGSACARMFRFSQSASLEMGGPSPSTTLPVMSTTLPRYSASFRFMVLSISRRHCWGLMTQELLHTALRHVVVDHP